MSSLQYIFYCKKYIVQLDFFYLFVDKTFFITNMLDFYTFDCALRFIQHKTTSQLAFGIHNLSRHIKSIIIVYLYLVNMFIMNIYILLI